MTEDPYAIGPRYGIIHNCECDLIDDITERLKREFGRIDFLEIGIYGGNTARGMYRRAAALGVPVICAGVDLVAPTDPVHPEYKFYQGDSRQLWREIKGDFNFLFIDADHSKEGAKGDFHYYSPMVVPGGYLLFHDTMSTAAMEHRHDIELWRQGPSDPNRLDAPRHGVREALWEFGLIQNANPFWETYREVLSNDYGMGMMCFKRRK